MKKLVAISVLFALLATAVFAQDGGWSNDWTIGLSATFATDMFYIGKTTGTVDKTQKTTPDAVLKDAEETYSTESGNYAKGTTNFFPNRRNFASDPGSRVSLSLNNSGENYAMSFNITIDDWANNYAGWNGDSILKMLIDGHQRDDWGIKGTAGIFYAGVGPWASIDGWVDANAMWGSWLDWGSNNRFGLWTYSPNGAGNYNHFNIFRTLGEWGEPFSLGISLGDNFRFGLGYKFGWNPDAVDTKGSKSAINGAFIFSGNVGEMITFDLFYAVQGQDTNTFTRPSTYFGYNDPSGKWLNNLGAYVQIKGLENLNLSLGYSAHFNAYEDGGFLNNDGTSDPVKYTAPITSGVDVRVGYSGIDKIGLKFNNNISFASATGDKIDGAKKDKINLLFSENFADARDNALGVTQNWFHWGSRLQAQLGFIDGVGLEVILGNNYGVFTDKVNSSITPIVQGATYTNTIETKRNTTNTSNQFCAVAGATYGIGNVTLGMALFFQWDSSIAKETSEVTTSSTQPGYVKTTVTKTSEVVDNTVSFGIPVYFKVSF